MSEEEKLNTIIKLLDRIEDKIDTINNNINYDTLDDIIRILNTIEENTRKE